MSASEDLSIAIWNPYTWELVYQIDKAHDYDIRCLLYLGSNYLASGGNDNTIKIWETLTYTFVRRLVGHKENVLTLEILSNGNLASGSYDNYTAIWNPTSGKLLGYYEPPFKTQVNSIKQLDNGLLAIVGNSGTMSFMNTDFGFFEPSLDYKTDGQNAYGTVLYDFDRGGKILATAFGYQAVLVFIDSVSTSLNSYYQSPLGEEDILNCIEHIPPGIRLIKCHCYLH